ncbi:PilN domain-containing protein [Ureibacillus thermophilus]|uniref:PilN domain-containing protein n=1 Tax=Ureibacillus thermophilus TaxID=367743 RepID=UPI00360AF757
MIPDINLLPKIDKRQSTSKWLYILLSVLTLLLVAFFVFQYFELGGKISDLRNEEQQVLAERNQLQAQLDNTAVDTGSLKQSVEFIEKISYAVSPIIDETVRLQPRQTYLREYAFDAQSVQLSMDFETLSDISNYISRLSKSSYFQDVQVTTIEHFEVGHQEAANNFHEIPRYKVKFTMMIDQDYLAAGGVE